MKTPETATLAGLLKNSSEGHVLMTGIILLLGYIFWLPV